jgi:hypothetical protein
MVLVLSIYSNLSLFLLVPEFCPPAACFTQMDAHTAFPFMKRYLTFWADIFYDTYTWQ